jgi:hypothetical protein
LGVDDVPEWKLRAAAIPGALAVALAFHAWPTGHWLQRTFLTMIVHELGHAVTAWWCGFGALPTLWKTLIPDARGAAAPIAVAVGWIICVVRGWMTGRWWLAVLGVALAMVQLVGTSSLSDEAAHGLIVFGGDAGAMVIGTLLMAGFFVPWLKPGGLRWGFLAIGAAAFVDTYATWWSARSDTDAIPFGEIEGVGLSDPSQLVERYGWTVRQLVDRYVAVGAVCLIAIAVVYAWAVWRAKSDT